MTKSERDLATIRSALGIDYGLQADQSERAAFERVTAALQAADDIARAALEELERLPDMQNLMISRTSLRELAETYLSLRESMRANPERI